MFRKIRRNKQLLSKEETIEVLKTCTSGTLGVTGDDEYPYTVPLSYVYKNDKLYFHCAKEGHKIDALKKNDKVSFCIIDTDDVSQKNFTTYFRSVIIFGRARILLDHDAREYGLKCLLEKYSPNYLQEGQIEIKKHWNNVAVIEVTIEYMTGKTSN